MRQSKLLFPGRTWSRLGLLSLAYISAFGGLWLSSLCFPHGYDWQRNTISALLSPRLNPEGHWLSSLGIGLGGISILPVIAWLESDFWQSRDTFAANLRGPSLYLGAILLILFSIVPPHPYPIMGSRHAHGIFLAHQLLAAIGSAFSWAGMLFSCASTGLHLPVCVRRQASRARAIQGVMSLGAAFTIAGILGSAAALFHDMAALHPTPDGTAYQGGLYWSLAFWEWVAVLGVGIFFTSPGLMLDSQREETAPLTSDHAAGKLQPQG